MTEAQSSLLQSLEATRTVMRQCSNYKTFVYIGREDFLLQHGQWYELAPWDGKFNRGAPKQCFANAMMAAKVEGLRYVEGIACIEGLSGLPIPHAWNVDANGRLYDLTWGDDGIAYYGVEFSVGRAEDAIWNGNANVLDDWERRHPLFMHPWTGEDFTRVWEPTGAMEHVRNMEIETSKTLRFLAEEK